MDGTDGNRYQEIRLGLVLYGGISLAIYINGVAQEFFRAVRGRGVYRLIKALTDSEIVVDILSGSSAGGINGILLAYALCNELEFSDCASLWRNHGDFLALLRSPRQKMEEVSSLLDGTYYRTCLEKALAAMRPCINDLPEYVSPLKELDLFVTGTDVQGRIYHTLDDAGHLIDVKDYRTVFQLKHRAGRKEPFSVKGKSDAQADAPETIRQSLAKMAQITGSFPVAFPPVLVGGRDDANEVDKNLRLWGAFDKEAFYLDGGILDNKPFTYTIRARAQYSANHVDLPLFRTESRRVTACRLRLNCGAHESLASRSRQAKLDEQPTQP